MFHRRCDERIAHLERLLDEAHKENVELREQIVLMSQRPALPARKGGPANVYYMDDQRLMEMMEEGDVPT